MTVDGRRRTEAAPWESGNPYETFMGRWSRPIARQFLTWLNASPNQRWLDLGCGTGALSSLILAQTQPARVTGVDPSGGFVAFAQQALDDARAEFKVGNALNLPLDDNTFDLAVSGLALNFVPQPDAALRELQRVVKPGGTIAVYLWDYAEGMQMLRYFWDAALTVDPSARNLDEGLRFPLCQPEPLTALFNNAGLKQVELTSLSAPTLFKNFADYWEPFLGGQGPAPGFVNGLASAQKTALEDKLRQTLPKNEDGSIPLTARAWAVKGQVKNQGSRNDNASRST